MHAQSNSLQILGNHVINFFFGIFNYLVFLCDFPQLSFFIVGNCDIGSGHSTCDLDHLWNNLFKLFTHFWDIVNKLDVIVFDMQ